MQGLLPSLPWGAKGSTVRRFATNYASGDTNLHSQSLPSLNNQLVRANIGVFAIGGASYA